MAALSVMVNLELSHVNILTKMDLLSKSARRQLDEYVVISYSQAFSLTLQDVLSCMVHIKYL